MTEELTSSYIYKVIKLPDWNSTHHNNKDDYFNDVINSLNKINKDDNLILIICCLDCNWGDYARSLNIEDLAKQRNDIHIGHSTRRELSKNYDLVGMCGERQFGIEFGMKPDISLKPKGDCGIDFITKAGSVDVKTYRKAFNLLREENKPHADIIVLSEFSEIDTSARLLGWEYSKDLLDCPKKDFGYGVVNHYKHKSQLREMKELKGLCGIDSELDGPMKIPQEVDDIAISVGLNKIKEGKSKNLFIFFYSWNEVNFSKLDKEKISKLLKDSLK